MSFAAEDLIDSVAALHRRLLEAGIPHAFGGALAAGHYGASRETDDIDVNLFVAPAEWPRVREALAPLGVGADVDRDALEREGQARLAWERVPIHLFFSTDALHAEMEGNSRVVTYGDATLPLVSPEHLVVRKRLLGRPKDERDIERVIEATPVDQAAVEEWVTRLSGERIKAD